MEEEVQVDLNSFRFVNPASIAVCGPTSCGKTYWVYKFLKYINTMFQDNFEPDKILYCYSVEQSLYETVKRDIPIVTFYQGIPDMELIISKSKEKNLVIVLDDLVHKIVDSQDMLLLFTQTAHHKKISVIFMMQNMYQSGKHARTIALNVKYIVLFANPRDTMQIKYLGRQIFPSNGERLYEAYVDAVNRMWGYLLVDLNHNTRPELRLRSNIFPDEGDMIIYIPCKK